MGGGLGRPGHAFPIAPIATPAFPTSAPTFPTTWALPRVFITSQVHGDRWPRHAYHVPPHTPPFLCRPLQFVFPYTHARHVFGGTFTSATCQPACHTAAQPSPVLYAT